MSTREAHHDLHQWVACQDPSWLADRLLNLITEGSPERAVIDLHRLLAEQLSDSSIALDLDRCRSLVVRAIVPRIKTGYADEYRISIAISEIMDATRVAGDQGRWESVRELSACLIDAIDQAYAFVDEGWTFEEPYEQLCALHLRACVAAPPEPGALRTWLAKKSGDSVSGAFDGAMDRYRLTL